MLKNFLDTIQSLTGGTPTKYAAKNRLELVLAHDRAGINPELIEQMRQEILEVVSRYIDIDIEAMEFSIQSNERKTSLSANLPIRKIKRINNPVVNNTDEATVLPDNNTSITPMVSEN